MSVKAKPNLTAAPIRMPADLRIRDVMHLSPTEVVDYINRVHATMNWLRGSIILKTTENDPFRRAMDTAFDDLDKIFFKEENPPKVLA